MSSLFDIMVDSFLDDLDRVAARSYEPTDDDIVRARLRTLGVQEHKIRFDQGSGNAFHPLLSRLSLYTVIF